MIRPICQNDDALDQRIQKAGCLFRSLSMLAEMKAGRCLSPEEIMIQYEWLVDHGYMNKNCYVLDHGEVIRSAQYYLNIAQTGAYIFRQSETGNQEVYNEGKATHFIRHVRTKNGYGHFYVSDVSGRMVWDPYWPSPEHEKTLTFRGYQL